MDDDFCNNDRDHDHCIAGDDDVLDFIIYEEITKEHDRRPSPSSHGCFSVLLLPILVITGLYLMMT